MQNIFYFFWFLTTIIMVVVIKTLTSSDGSSGSFYKDIIKNFKILFLAVASSFMMIYFLTSIGKFFGNIVGNIVS